MTESAHTCCATRGDEWQSWQYLHQADSMSLTKKGVPIDIAISVDIDIDTSSNLGKGR